MKLLKILFLLGLISGTFATLSQINLSPTANYAKLTTKQGLWVSLLILKFLLLGEFGIFPFKFIGRKKRDSDLSMQTALADSNSILQLLRSLDHQDCLLRYLCELEAMRHEADRKKEKLPSHFESELYLLKIAKKNLHPGVIMRRDPASPVLPFETAIFTGSQGFDSCATIFKACPYNITTMQTFGPVDGF